ncbi:uncharacterized protein LOC110990567 isoform X1 [Acanthaster planci]|uniref:Uncharacterized protein LOC110990567 isoform X1 n=1 Tax=Acanthaster planci TaxID=133434 RepID=A0A8B8A1S7_ACAPL|nr:uncharacterized protein LOC110990567 isoform X1 [Acanthaster planci]
MITVKLCVKATSEKTMQSLCIICATLSVRKSQCHVSLIGFCEKGFLFVLIVFHFSIVLFSIANCLEIAAPGNGSLTHSTAEWRRNGSRIDFSCDPGFSLVGAASVTCENGQWDHPVPTCFESSDWYLSAILPVAALVVICGLLWKRKWLLEKCSKIKVLRLKRPAVQPRREKLPYVTFNLQRTVSCEGIPVRCRLISESEILENGIAELRPWHVVIEGKCGSGKSTLLRELKRIHMESKHKLWHRNVGVLTDVGNLDNALTSIKRNVWFRLHLSNLLILVDDCNGENDITDVLENVRNKGLFGCRLVMTTTNATSAQNMSRDCDLRHVTIGGFSDPHSGEESYAQKLGKISKGNCSDLLKRDILSPNITQLPAILDSLISLESKTSPFNLHSTFGSLIVMALKCMFGKLDNNLANGDSGISGPLTEPQTAFAINCGKVCLSRMINGCENPAEVPKRDFVNGVVENGIKMGLFQESEGRNSNREDATLRTNADGSLKFVLEVFAVFCASKHMAQNVQEWLPRINGSNVEKFENLLVFAACSSQSHDTAHTIVNHLAGIIHQEREVIDQLRDRIQLEKFIDVCLEINFEGRMEGRLNDLFAQIFPEGRLCFTGMSGRRLRCLAYMMKYAYHPDHEQNVNRLRDDEQNVNRLRDNEQNVNLKCVQLCRLERQTPDEFRECTESLYPGAFGNLRAGDETRFACENREAVARMTAVRRQLESRERYLPRFPSDLSDGSVLRSIHSWGLQEITELQYGECHSSTSASEFVRYLLQLEDLDSIVLLGTIIDSQQIRDLVHALHKFKKFKRIDFRFNKEMDNRAFKKAMLRLSACKDLVDLRLSLYKVDGKGFSQVTKKISKVEPLLRRLETLHLLHVSAVEPFCDFIQKILQYMNNLQCIHVSALAEDENPDARIPHMIVEKIRQEKPNLKELFVDGKNELTSERGVADASSTSSGSAVGRSGDAILEMESKL